MWAYTQFKYKKLSIPSGTKNMNTFYPKNKQKINWTFYPKNKWKQKESGFLPHSAFTGKGFVPKLGSKKIGMPSASPVLTFLLGMCTDALLLTFKSKFKLFPF